MVMIKNIFADSDLKQDNNGGGTRVRMETRSECMKQLSGFVTIDLKI